MLIILRCLKEAKMEIPGRRLRLFRIPSRLVSSLHVPPSFVARFSFLNLTDESLELGTKSVKRLPTTLLEPFFSHRWFGYLRDSFSRINRRAFATTWRCTFSLYLDRVFTLLSRSYSLSFPLTG